MRTSVHICIAALLIVLLSTCKSDKKDEVWHNMPGEVDLKTLKQTSFVPTLENPVTEKDNVIYTPAFLFAWQGLSKILGSPLVSNEKNSTDLRLLTKSDSYKNSLADSEYTVEAIIGVGVEVRAFFRKVLPFKYKMQALEKPIVFDHTKVTAFGMIGRDDDIIKETSILYYQDDEHFVLKLSPNDQHYEIILAKGIANYTTLKNGTGQINNLIDKGNLERKNERLSWKYYFRQDDEFSIPKLKFNLSTHYKEIEGQSLTMNDGKKNEILEAYQRTGLILNENGAVVESEATTVSVTPAEIPEPKLHPKKMIFDKPFMIIIKRSDRSNPCFVMKVANAELLEKVGK